MQLPEISVKAPADFRCIEKVIRNQYYEGCRNRSRFMIEDCFAPAIVATLCPVADDVQAGWVRQEDGSFAAPVVEEVVTPTEPVPE